MAVTYEIPEGTEPKKCRSCNATIYWVRTAADKPMPVDPSGETHFGSCKQSKQWSGSSRKQIGLFE